MNSAEDDFKAGDLENCRQTLMAAIRSKPGDESKRLFLFQLALIDGDWKRAENQLEVVKELSAESQMLAALFKPMIHLEAFRAEVFAGRRSPVLLGEPPEWMAQMIQALSAPAESAQALRASALEAAEAFPGKLNGAPFDWLMDADGRMGPVMEVFHERKYFWVPFEHLSGWSTEPPTEARDLVWQPIQLSLRNGGEIHGFTPVRYPGTETHEDPAVRLARKTLWEGPNGSIGIGQRLWATESADFPTLEVRQVSFDHE